MRACQNCGEPLLGDHCYACGQPVKGLVRHFSSIIGDFLDTVFNIDTRVVRTLGPLLAKPGYLSNEYFAGRRVRYVSPVRLFFFLSIVTFFVAQFAVDFGDNQLQFNGRDDDMARATTVAEVERVRDAALKELADARADIPSGVPGARAGVDAGANAVRSRAADRIAELQRATARGEVPKEKTAASADDDVDLTLFGDKPWDAKTNPIKFQVLPDFANAWLNAQVQHTKDNIKRYQQNPNLFKDAVLSAVPSTLFLLLPVFALMLKLAYAFKRRLYMEHLIVALHSHAFLCLALLLQIGLAAAGTRAGADARGPAQRLQPAAGRFVGLDAVVPAADAEAGVWAGLADDPAEVLRAGHLLCHPAEHRRCIHHARQPGMDVKTMLLVYEVNLEFDRAIEADYRAWLATHVRDILALPGFTGAEVFEVLDPPPTAGRIGLSVRYLMRDRAALDDYLREHAPRLRAEGLERFGEEGVRIRRRVLRETSID